MNEPDNLQDFIADCEWKTRKILRESNKKMKDNARLHSAKEQSEQHKLEGKISDASDQERSVKLPHEKKIALKEWKERDKIIHDACETIKSISVHESPQRSRKKNNDQSHSRQIHASLHSSPFHSASKGKTEKRPRHHDISLKKDEGKGSGEPEVITRRTIERDFYIMSKKRSKLRSKRHERPKDDEESIPELKSSVLWKKYRCDDRVMRAKSKRAAKLYKQYERLPPVIGEVDSSTTTVKDNNSDNDLASSDDEEECTHPLHELVERYIAEENIRSQKQWDEMVLERKLTSDDVKSIWDELQKDRDFPCKDKDTNDSDDLNKMHDSLSNYWQVPSVPLHVATKKVLKPIDDNISEGDIERPVIIDDRPTDRRVTLYSKPSIKLYLINNEPLAIPLIDRPISLAISISIEINEDAENNSSKKNQWTFDLYDPSNGNTRLFKLTESEFDVLMSMLSLHTPHQKGCQVVQKIVHRQIDELNGCRCIHAVKVFVDQMKITAVLLRSKSEFESDIEHFDIVCSLQVSEVLQLLEQHHLHHVLDIDFWLNDSNGPTVWKHMIDSICCNPQVLANNTSMVYSVRAYESLLALSWALKSVKHPNDIEKVFHSIQKIENKSESNLCADAEDPGSVCPLLSMRISSHSPYSSTICPGHTACEIKGIWPLLPPTSTEESEASSPIWPSSTDVPYRAHFDTIQASAHLDTTQASAYFFYKNLGHQRGASIAVLNRLAFESPVLAPKCYVTYEGFITPPLSMPEEVNGIIPQIKLEPISLLETPLKSRFDTVCPQPVVVLDPAATESDWIDAPRDKDGKYFHLRDVDEFNKDGFRIKTFADKIDYDDSITTIAFGISEEAVTPNIPTTTRFLTSTSSEYCTQPLSRERTAEDYHYIAESDSEGTLNDPHFFTVHMKGYSPSFVSRKSLKAYIEEEKNLMAAKEEEKRKNTIAMKMKAADEIVEARLKELTSRIDQSLQPHIELPHYGCTQSLASSSDTKHSTFQINHDRISHSMVTGDYRINDKVSNLQVKDLNSRADEPKLTSSKECDDQTHSGLSAARCVNTSTKYYPSEQRKQESYTMVKNEIGNEETGENKLSVLSSSTPQTTLSSQKYNERELIGNKGDSWRKISRADTNVGELNFDSRKIITGWERPKLGGIEGCRKLITLNAVEKVIYKSDPENFEIKTRTIFIPDLISERLRLYKSKRHQESFEKSILSEHQQCSLEEILQIPISSGSLEKEVSKKSSEMDNNEDIPESNVKKSRSNSSGSQDNMTIAILAVKNGNLPELERMLNTEGLPVDTRDQHGNTLFILACQQGNKKLAKFLLRLGADINAQNNGGNAALHYLHEYHHTSLAEYLIRKGANDNLRNVDGLTVYEGVHQEKLLNDYDFDSLRIH